MTMVKELPIDERPRERLLSQGPTYLSNAEILAILIRNGHRDRSALQVAEEILSRNKESGMAGLAKLTVHDLIHIKGVGTAKAAELLAAIELGKRMGKYVAQQRTVIACPNDAAEYAMPQLKYEDREHFAIILMNIKNHVLSMPIISIGSLTASVVHPREVFKVAIQQTAAAMILVHNHPSGDPEPSRDDINITNRLVQAGKLMDIPVLDHIILGDNKYISLKEKGMIK